MQPIDPTDDRPPYLQIAASIRAAILTGEFAPESQLPTGQELAKFFGVSRMTVQTAIRTLRDEGFIRSRAGSGVYVRHEAQLPAPNEKEHALAGTAAFLYEMGRLKHLARAGWDLLAIPQPETVAEHSFRTAIVGIVLATLEDADVGRTTELCLLHDAHETRIGDIEAVGRAYVSTALPEAVTAHQTAAMPDKVAKVFNDLVAEFEGEKTVESKIAHDAHQIETLIQAREYQAQGHDTTEWQDPSINLVRTESGRQLAQAITRTDPHQWFLPFCASYRELRATTRGSRSSRRRPREM